MKRPAFPIAVLLVAGCASTPDIRTDFDPSADFSRFRTYSWVYQSVPQGMNPISYQRVHDSIDRALAARGFSQASPGDFAVAFTLGARDRVVVTDMGPYGGFYPGWGRAYRWGWAPVYRQVDVRQVTDGTLAIDIYDATTHRPVWHGVATQQVTPGRVSQEIVDNAVTQVLARFPPQPGDR